MPFGGLQEARSLEITLPLPEKSVFFEVPLGNLTSAHVHIGKWLDMSRETEATVSALGELTKRQDLHLLTTLPLKGYVKRDSVLRLQRAWCPDCYQEQRSAGQPVYDLLIWSFRDVCVCRRHNRRLRSSCYWCTQAEVLQPF